MDLMEHMDDALKGIVPFAMPGDGKFNYPIDTKQTQQATEAMIKAEQNLDIFWSKFDVNWKKLARKSIEASMGIHRPFHRELERTSPWMEPIKDTPTETLKKPKQWRDSSNEKIPVVSKGKTKTKGIAQVLEGEKPVSEAPS